MSNPITPQNPRGAGRKSTGKSRQITLCGLSDELEEWLDSQPNKSLFVRSILQDAYDRK